MNWEEWVASKKKKYIAVVLFILAYIATIPWRDYSSFFDTTQGVTIWMHLTLIVIGLVVLLIGLKIIEVIVKKYILDKGHKKK